MADHRLRSLERAAMGSGSAYEQGRFIHERVRVGELDNHRIALAAFLGHEGARLALPDDYFTCEAHKADTIHTDGWHIESVVRDLSRWGIHAQARAAVAIGYRVFGVWIIGQVDNWADDLRRPTIQCLRAAEDWIVCPCLEHQRACEQYANNLGAQVSAGWQWAAAIMIAGKGISTKIPIDALIAAVRSCRNIPFDHNAHKLRTGSMSSGAPIVDDQTTMVYESALFETVQRALIPWTLRDGDPVKDRVDGRS